MCIGDLTPPILTVLHVASHQHRYGPNMTHQGTASEDLMPELVTILQRDTALILSELLGDGYDLCVHPCAT